MRRLCDRYDILLIYDEVVTGFGRTGKLFGLEHFDAMPDMVSMAKGLAAGHFPVGALAFREPLYDRLLAAARSGAGHVFYHTHTFFGNPVAGAVGLKAIELLERRGLVQHVASVGERLLAGLETLRDTGLVGDVRGIGLLAAVELVQDPATGAPFDRDLGVARQVYREAADRGCTRAGQRIRRRNHAHAAPDNDRRRGGSGSHHVARGTDYRARAALSTLAGMPPALRRLTGPIIEDADADNHVPEHPEEVAGPHDRHRRLREVRVTAATDPGPRAPPARR